MLMSVASVEEAGIWWEVPGEGSRLCRKRGRALTWLNWGRWGIEGS